MINTGDKERIQNNTFKKRSSVATCSKCAINVDGI
jgi:hypothetical protein